ncbi:MAG: ABC transporter substrate-binding protein [Alphaproteobacteria bacterium]|jgi:ABC-type amino acid transport substrate-binding protein|nr:ABC transporter substrate-binding protein [Alphaproteobacteria bacterium]MBT4018207.1 ABC transporter substrate-binding protein [Alphaproteobacteria bacterium]MBT4965066.1 ABC transporter substrate-binding protein [Alphaproteobacteria bacterium]MBT5160746.1 ABC transporter substrate-binding protein [Alphaproteobacteria bacterium]MBT5918440.1 ABC transporter substrate-binding protein [Alphaproteobacteria bacterium]
MSSLFNRLLIILVTGLMTNVAQAQTTKPVFALLDFKPFGNSTSNGFDGIFARSMDFIQAESGIDVTTQMLPIPRSLKAIADGSAQLIITGAVSRLLENTDSLGIIGCSRIIVLTSAKSGIKNLADLEGKNIGFVASGFLDKLYSNKFDLIPHRIRNSQSMVAMLDRNRIDGFFISDVVIDAFETPASGSSMIKVDWRSRLGERIEVRKIATHLRIAKDYGSRELSDRLRSAVAAGNAKESFSAIYKSYGVLSGGKC